MTVLSQPLGLAAFALLVLLHALSVFLPQAVGRPLAYVNLALHACFAPLILFLQAQASAPSIEEAVMLYMASLFAYTLFYSMRHAVCGFLARRAAARRMAGAPAVPPTAGGEPVPGGERGDRP